MNSFAIRVRRKLRLLPQSKALDIYKEATDEFQEFEPLLDFHQEHFANQRASEAALSRQNGTVEIFHASRNYPATVAVATSAKFLDLYNFRESFVDPSGLNARQRQLLLATQRRIEKRNQKAALFEYNTPLHNELSKSGLLITPSHFVGDPSDPLHQDLQRLGYADAAFDFAIHSDVLEHVPNAHVALRECFRILRPGGRLIFTTPMFPMQKNMLRAEIDDAGNLIRHLPDEIHGDNLTGGILTFHNFGWELVEILREIGFTDVGVEVCVEPKLGLFSTNCPIWTSLDPFQPGNMLPIVLKAVKPR
ncbi:methyltransferase family protein [Litoreibacter ponti]|uniref:Methyltransferase family protein n=1 Tax=Litoreibacter ponti TaxID=1510457 RepID=A0A2T6BP05_9RHOB|nr:class I SAM-dependent methyltransferase [Litoreibacter ponti]PTX57717.1 methyltransferase family protein [Litoreibacter ponti]